MLVTLTNTSAITVDLPAQVRWAGAAARSFGTAEVTIPRNSPAFAAAYVDRDGGSLIEIKDANLGTWRGIIQKPRISRNGVQLSANHQAKLVDIRLVSRNRSLRNMTAGAIVKAAVNDAVVGLGPAVLRAGTFVEAAPIIDNYEFRGQKLSQVLADMMEQSGQEWSLSDDGALSWVAPQGTLYSVVLCDDGDVTDGEREADVNDRTAEVYAVDGQGREIVVRNGDADPTGRWPRQEKVDAGGANAAIAGRQAAALAAARRTSTVTYALRLRGSTHQAGIREGDFLQTVLPYADFGGVAPLVRVLERSFVDGRTDETLVVQDVPAFDTSTIFRAVGEAGPSNPAPARSTDTDVTQMVAKSRDAAAELSGRVEQIEIVAEALENGDINMAGTLKALGLRASGDPAGLTGNITITGVDNTATVRGAGVGTVLFADGTSRNCVGFLKVKKGTTDYYVPLFAAN